MERKDLSRGPAYPIKDQKVLLNERSKKKKKKKKKEKKRKEKNASSMGTDKAL